MEFSRLGYGGMEFFGENIHSPEKAVLSFVTAFIFNNGLIGNRMQFFTDGHKTLNETILNCFNWLKNIGIILDWYHLEKKCFIPLMGDSAILARVQRTD